MEEDESGVFLFPEKSPVELIRIIAHVTAPDLSLFFCIAFAIVAYFHESYFSYVAVFLSAWLLIQLISNVLDDDFKNDLFWNIFSLFGNLVFYLFLGNCWCMLKLYLDIWRGHMDPILMDRIRTCVTTDEVGCVIPLFMDMKWMIVRWMTTWPINLVYTLSRDPLQIITDLIYTWSRQRYFTIMASAVRAYDVTQLSNGGATTWSDVAVFSAYILIYLVLGYAWTHVKLFIDVWQGALPASLDAQVRDVYNKQTSYWEFVKKIKWHVTQWLLTWPLSIIYTLIRHPLRILADFVYELSQRKYVWIVGKAMNARMKKNE